MQPLADGFAATRDHAHALAEHVLAPARFAIDGRIGLQVVPGGFGTPVFGSGGRSVSLVGPDIVVTGSGGAMSSAETVTSIRQAADFVGVVPGAPPVYHPATNPDYDTPLALSPAAMQQIADWYALVHEALGRFAPGAHRTLWPEHFDLAITDRAVNFGGALGDGFLPEPYLYVGPHDLGRIEPGGFWDQPFGASLSHREVGGVDDAVQFFREGRHRLD